MEREAGPSLFFPDLLPEKQYYYSESIRCSLLLGSQGIVISVGAYLKRIFH